MELTVHERVKRVLQTFTSCDMLNTKEIQQKSGLDSKTVSAMLFQMIKQKMIERCGHGAGRTLFYKLIDQEAARKILENKEIFKSKVFTKPEKPKEVGQKNITDMLVASMPDEVSALELGQGFLALFKYLEDQLQKETSRRQIVEGELLEKDKIILDLENQIKRDQVTQLNKENKEVNNRLQKEMEQNKILQEKLHAREIKNQKIVLKSFKDLHGRY